MQTINTYSKKAENYAKFRWDYSPHAVEEIFKKTGLCEKSIVADIGAGTGILTRHFCGRVKRIYAIEPNPEMRQQAYRLLAFAGEVKILDTTAESTTIEDHEVDLITVAQAIHWFDPEAARQEFKRILIPDGWLALLRNIPTGNQATAAAMNKVLTPEYGVEQTHSSPGYNINPLEYYGCSDIYRTVFPFSFEENWEEFFGALCSASFIPNEDHHLYSKFKAEVKKIFHQFCNPLTGMHLATGETELILGILR